MLLTQAFAESQSREGVLGKQLQKSKLTLNRYKSRKNRFKPEQAVPSIDQCVQPCRVSIKNS